METATAGLRAKQRRAVTRPAAPRVRAWFVPAACALTLLAAPGPPAFSQADPAVVRDVGVVNRMLQERAAREAVKSPPPQPRKPAYSDAELEEAVGFLASEDAGERKRGAHRLRDAGAAAVPLLAAALEDPEERVRVEVAALLGETKDPRGAAPLVSRLSGTEREWDKVYPALRAIGAPAVPPLIEALEDNDTAVRRRAVRLLGVLRDGRATERLVELLNKDRSTGVRVDVAVALGRLKDRGACEALLDALHDW